MDWSDYEVDGQITITDYLKSQIEIRKVQDFTSFLNSQVKSQYQQIGDIIKKTYEENNDSSELIGRLTNNVSVYVLEQSIKYSEYLRNESNL